MDSVTFAARLNKLDSLKISLCSVLVKPFIVLDHLRSNLVCLANSMAMLNLSTCEKAN